MPHSVGQIYDLYYEALEDSRDAFALGLFGRARQALSRALHQALALQIPRRVAKIEVLAQEQLQHFEERSTHTQSTSASDELTQYRTLIELVANYRNLVESAFQCATLIDTSFLPSEQKVEYSPMLDMSCRIDRANNEVADLWCETISWRQKIVRDREVIQEQRSEVAQALSEIRRLREAGRILRVPIKCATA